MTKEVKAMGGEGKALAAEMMAAFEAYKSANDERLAEIESKGASDTLLDDKLRKLDKRLDALSLKAARPDVARGCGRGAARGAALYARLGRGAGT